MTDVIKQLYDIILERKNSKIEGSYTCYLFEKGLDKILKKIGEESAETIIAAKGDNKEEIVNECADLIYHLLVMMCEKDIDINELTNILEERRQKVSNLKVMKNTDKNT